MKSFLISLLVQSNGGSVVEANPALIGPALLALEKILIGVGVGPVGLTAVLDYVLDKSTDRVWYHYTDKEHFSGIKNSRTIYTNLKGKVYLTDMPFNPGEAFQNLFLNQNTHSGKGDYVIVFTLDRVQEFNLSYDPNQPFEYVHYGPVKPINIIYQVPNPY